jgi:hypothetical protein
MTEDMQRMLESAAFPFTHHSDGDSITATGMTLRDYFAAKAMQGLLASSVNGKMDEFASRSYKMADAMLKTRAE